VVAEASDRTVPKENTDDDNPSANNPRYIYKAYPFTGSSSGWHCPEIMLNVLD
jgi:hypothetical protein